MREAVHKAGHGLATIQEDLTLYRAKACGVGECGYLPHNGSSARGMWAALAGPAAEFHFFGTAGECILTVVRHLPTWQQEQWRDDAARWAARYEDQLLSLAGELA